MSKNEDYLDKLLHSVSDDSESDLKGKEEYLESEEDIMNDFEHELAQEDGDDIIRSFEKELSQQSELEEKKENSDERENDAFLNNLENLVNTSQEQVKAQKGIELDDMEVNTISETPGKEQEAAMTLDEKNIVEEPEKNSEKETTDIEQEKKDISNQKDSQEVLDEENMVEADESKGLQELLSEMSGEEGELADIGELLNAEENHTEIDMLTEEGDKQESMQKSEDNVEPKDKTFSEEKEQKKEKTSKSFWKKLALIFFGPEEEEENEQPEKSSVDLDKMTEEERAAYEMLNGGNGKSEKKKKKEKKAKKPKKEKPKKEKKPKPKKPPKPKKAKKPKEIDNSPPLPRVPVVLIFIMAFSIGGMILLGSKVLGYTSTVSTAKEMLNNQDYMGAYRTLNGMAMKEKDKDSQRKAELMAYLQAEYDAYNTYMSIRDYEGALDCLIRGIGRYDMHYEEAQGLDIGEEYDKVEHDLEQKLHEQFNVSLKEARRLYNIKNRRDYTKKIIKIINKLGLE